MMFCRLVSFDGHELPLRFRGWGIGSRPDSRATFVSAKVAKTIDAPSGHVEREGRQPFEERPNSLRSNKGR